MNVKRVLAVVAGLAVFAAAATLPAGGATTDGAGLPASVNSGAAPAVTSMPMPATASSSTAVAESRLVTVVRSATWKFHDVATAEAAGYVQFQDVDKLSCIAEPGMGAMGVHYVNPKLIGDPAIDPAKPEALVYAPEPDGTLRLAAVEYLVDAVAWSTAHSTRPALVAGEPFGVTGAPNRYGLPKFYSQHVWAWVWNSAGLLAMWNPQVKCLYA